MKKRILFVDDEPGILDMLRRMLHKQENEWDMRFALSAEEALKTIDETPFDAVISDVRMPGKDGFELLDTLRHDAKTKDIPVIILTGESEPAFKRRALDLGATDLLNKPCSIEDLLARIRSALRLKAYQDELRAQNEVLDRKVRERTAELELSRLDIIRRLAKAGEYRDEDTGNHVARVGWCCRIVAEALRLERDFIELLFLTSPLHDIGKIGVSDTILLKRGKLTPEERNIMKQHCAIGAGILREEPKGLKLHGKGVTGNGSDTQAGRKDPLIDMAAVIAFGHHERWDGKGYPQGLKEGTISLEARIVGIVDVYDALSSARPYKPALPEEKVLEIMCEERGRHFDPEVFTAFENVLGNLKTVRDQLYDDADIEAS